MKDKKFKTVRSTRQCILVGTLAATAVAVAGCSAREQPVMPDGRAVSITRELARMHEVGLIAGGKTEATEGRGVQGIFREEDARSLGFTEPSIAVAREMIAFSNALSDRLSASTPTLDESIFDEATYPSLAQFFDTMTNLAKAPPPAGELHQNLVGVRRLRLNWAAATSSTQCRPRQRHGFRGHPQTLPRHSSLGATTRPRASSVGGGQGHRRGTHGCAAGTRSGTMH